MSKNIHFVHPNGFATRFYSNIKRSDDNLAALGTCRSFNWHIYFLGYNEVGRDEGEGIC